MMILRVTWNRMMVGWDVFFGECIRVHWNAFDALAREHQARLAFGEGVASGSFYLKPGLFWQKTRQLGLLKLAKFEKWHPDVASRGLFLAGKPSRSEFAINKST